MATDAEITAMRSAFVEARKTPSTLPNPQVGCVLLDETGTLIAAGHHRGAGNPHAEVEALRAAGDAARGATAVVTLEPCNHTGRTGPCSVALLEAGVSRVVYSASDPNPGSTGGAEFLRANGVDVEAGVLAAEGEELIGIWAHRIRTGRPFVTWKFAATLDGRSAAADGTSRWISSVESRRDVHKLRAACDAIAAGTGTVLTDNPKLTARDENDQPLAADRQPLRVVIGEREVPTDRHVHDASARTVFISERDPHLVLERLAAEGIHHVLLEGGPTLAGAWLEAEVVDQVVAYMAPKLLGAGTNALVTRIGTISDAIDLELTDVAVVGPDVRITAKPLRRKS